MEVFVTDPIQDVVRVERRIEQRPECREAGGAEDLEYAVAHPEIGADRALHLAVTSGEDIGGRPAHIDRENPLSGRARDEREDPPEGGRRGEQRTVHPLLQPGIPRRLRHDMFHKELMDRVPRGAESLPRGGRTQIVDGAEEEPLSQRLAHIGKGVAIAGEDDRQLRLRIALRMEVGLLQQLSEEDRSRDRFAIEPAGQQHQVGTESFQLADLLVGRPSVVDGQDVQHDRPRAEGDALGAAGGDGADQAGHGDGESPARARGGEVRNRRAIVAQQDEAFGLRWSFALALGLDRCQRPTHADGDILIRPLDRGRGFAATHRPGLAISPQTALEEDRLGGRAADIGHADQSRIAGGDRIAHRVSGARTICSGHHLSRRSNSSNSASAAWGITVPGPKMAATPRSRR